MSHQLTLTQLLLLCALLGVTPRIALAQSDTTTKRDSVPAPARRDSAPQVEPPKRDSVPPAPKPDSMTPTAKPDSVSAAKGDSLTAARLDSVTAAGKIEVMPAVIKGDSALAAAPPLVRRDSVRPVARVPVARVPRSDTAHAVPASAMDRGLAYHVSGMDGRIPRRDIAYKNVPTANASPMPVDLKLDVYRPARMPKLARWPAVIFVAGGIVPGQGPMPKEWTIYKRWGQLAAASGLIGITFEHRMTVSDNVAEAASDLEDLIKHVRDSSAAYGIDPDRLCVAFFSAGGPISSALLREPRPYVRCIVLYYPFLDLGHMREQTPFRAAHPASHVDSLAPRWSPAAVIGTKPYALPPILLVKAGRDQIQNLNLSIDRFIAAALAANVTLDLMTHPTGLHGFDVQNHDARSREIIEETIRFIRRHTGR